VLERVLAEIDGEIARLESVKALLAGVSSPVKRGRGRPPGAATKAPAKKTSGRRTMSPEARERIRQAQLKRWAATKKSAKGASK